MSDKINTLPEITSELMQAGFSVEIADDHSQIFVTLRRRVTMQEICDALGWNDDIPENVGMAPLGNGVAIIDSCPVDDVSQ